MKKWLKYPCLLLILACGGTTNPVEDSIEVMGSDDLVSTDLAALDTQTDADTAETTGSAFTCPFGICDPGHRPGTDCNSCHTFTFAGTMYGPAGKSCGPYGEGVPDVVVDGVLGDGSSWPIATTDCDGNFHIDSAISTDLTMNFRIAYSANGITFTKTMPSATSLTTTTKTSCNACHSASGSAGSPVSL